MYLPLGDCWNVKVVCIVCRCKFGQQGQGYGQFNSPHGFCLGVDDDIVVADTMNHRIEVFDKNGEHKYQFGIPGMISSASWLPTVIIHLILILFASF